MAGAVKPCGFAGDRMYQRSLSMLWNSLFAQQGGTSQRARHRTGDYYLHLHAAILLYLDVVHFAGK